MSGPDAARTARAGESPARPAATGRANDHPEGAGMPTGAVARHLGVSPTTVRSWERRYGIGPADRRRGHHRRWSPSDIAALEAMCRLTARGVPPAEAARTVLAARDRPPAPPAPAAGTGALAPGSRAPGPGGSRALHVGSVRPECRGLARAAVRLDAPEVGRILQEAVTGLGAVDAWTEVMLPALRAVGRKWASDGEQYVEVEHLLSWHVATTLRAAAVRPTAPRAVPPVLLAAMPNEQHTLPLDAVAAGLTERALPFRMLGAAVPPRALLDAVRRTGPGAVMLWAQSPHTTDPELVRQVVRTAWGARGSRTHALVLATGPGWRRSDHPEGTAGPRTLLSALDLLERAAAA
ncbi:MerR family transcriptional regulator [Kitasatospora sp. NPDC127111]|uniref:MerR family transcriptional regulator n=1 Tax=Kitasatospora sp. NPDC127111 TaxID=3345363 RepID=UPI003624E43B